jgi:hypothetical protein
MNLFARYVGIVRCGGGTWSGLRLWDFVNCYYDAVAFNYAASPLM